MGRVVRSTKSTRGSHLSPEKHSLPKVKLPTKVEEPSGDLNDFSFLIHGEKKIGKTKLALQGGKVLLLQFDPPQRAYARMEVVCSDYRTFLGAMKSLEKAAEEGEFPYDRVVVDGADTWARYCQAYVCEKMAIKHPEEESWGKGWDAVRTEFSKSVRRILNLPCGVWFICHSSWKEVESRTGNKIERLSPILGKMPEETLNSVVDAWCAYCYQGRSRILVVHGDEMTGAGHRLDSVDYPHFRTPSGKRVIHVPMGRSAEEGYENLCSAFNNKQEEAEPGTEPKKVRKTRSS